MNELKFSKRKQVGRHITDKPDSKPIKKDEATLQRQCEELLDWMKIKYIRIPDSLWRNKAPIYTKKLMSKYLKGLPDLTILFNNGTYLCVELKTKVGTLTQGQKNFAKYIDELHEIRSFDDFEKLINLKISRMKNS